METDSAMPEAVQSRSARSAGARSRGAPAKPMPSRSPMGAQQARGSASLAGDVDRLQTQPARVAKADTALARSILRRLFRDTVQNFQVQLWDGSATQFGAGDKADFTLVFHHPHAFVSVLLTQSPLRLGHHYINGGIDVEGDFGAAADLRHSLASLSLPLRDKLALCAKLVSIDCLSTYRDIARDFTWRKPFQQLIKTDHDKAFNREAISFHYDVSNHFYQLWLDRQMVYSCAYFENPEQSLDQAQCNKLDHICRKLRLQAGEKLLDVGCGWGALICWAAERYGASAHGITLSQQQHDYVKALIQRRGLEGKVSVELLDYRDLNSDGRYDKAVSVGMFEHVGLKNLPLYFETVCRQLKPGGLFLNHGITMEAGGWKKTAGTAFINRYVFPDGQLERVSVVQQTMEDAGFEVHDVESLRSHYALTLEEWVRRLEARHDEALKYVTEPTYRIWRLYMTLCAQKFREGGIGIYQILISKRQRYHDPIPLTRRDIYEGSR